MIIDLSLEIDTSASEPVQVGIEYIDHIEGARLLGKEIGLTENEFPDNMGLSLEKVSLTTHTGTHIDAPLHYGPYCENKPSKSISEVPLEWFLSSGVLLRIDDDIHRGDVTLNEIKQQLNTIKYKIKDNDIVLLQTNGDKHWGKPEYFTHFRGISLEATNWILEQGVKVIGVDTFGFDAPFWLMLDRYKKTKDKNVLWPTHILGREKEYCQIERLTNLNSIPVQYGFKVACFPSKIARSGAGWSRVVAII